MSSVGAGLLDHSDLGLPEDSDACRDLAEELGAPPPWPVQAIKAYFDRRYPGWDDAPQLALSSPVSRLRGLAEAAAQGVDDEGASEALRELGPEVKHAQIRVMCPRADGGGLHEECNFLLLALERLGGLLLAEREGRRRERTEAAQRREDEAEARRSTAQESAAAAREEARRQLEELAADAEAQHKRADELQRTVDALQVCEGHRVELEQRVEELERENLKLRHAHETSQEDLQAARAQRAALVAAKEEGEGALEELRLRYEQATALATDGTGAGVSPGSEATTHSNGSACGAAYGTGCAEGNSPGRETREALAKGARATLALLGAAGAGGAGTGAAPLRLALLAWRCAGLEAKFASIGAAAAATSLEADLSVMGCSRVGSALCCCRNGQESCCRRAWLKAALELVEEQRQGFELARAEASGALARAAQAASAARRFRFVAVISMCAFLCLAFEPQLTLSVGW